MLNSFITMFGKLKNKKSDGKSFFDFFPAPEFLSMPRAGISISDSSVRVIEFTKKNGKLILKKYGKRLLPQGIVSSGFIYDHENLSRVLKELKDELKLSFVSISLPEEKAYLYKTEIPNVKPDEIRSSLEFTIEENVPLRLDNVVFDYRVIPSVSSGNNKKLHAIVSVLPSKVSDIYFDVVKDAGLVPISFEVESQAATRALVKNGDNKNYIIINAGKRNTGFYIASGGFVIFSSTLPYGSVDFLSSSGKQEDTKEGKNFTVIRNMPGLFSFKDEIRKLSLYWSGFRDSDVKEKEIEKIILCGEEAGNDKFFQAIAKDVGMHIERGNVWNNAFSMDEYVPEITQKESLAYVTAAGIALPTEE